MQKDHKTGKCIQKYAYINSSEGLICIQLQTQVPECTQLNPHLRLCDPFFQPKLNTPVKGWPVLSVFVCTSEGAVYILKQDFKL